ncbi:MAG: rhodanese-like domain-containing protein [Acidimicrobiales bacterium]
MREVTTEEASAAREAGATILDIREPDEVDQGIIPGAITVVRGNLEAQIENRIPDKSTPSSCIARWCPVGICRQVARRTGLHRCCLDGRRIQQVEGRRPRVVAAKDPHRRPTQPLQPAPSAS